MSGLALIHSANHWLSDECYERKGEFKKLTMSVSDPGKKVSGERIANLEKMTECPALLKIQFLIYCLF
jgi:hypothetical protein